MDELVQTDLWRQLLVLIPVAVALLISAYTDFKERKVFNKVTYPFVIIGLLTHAIALGLPGLGNGAMSVVIALFIGIALLPFGWIGGGDIKLLMGVGAALGWVGLLEVTFYSIWVGAVMGLVMAAVNGYLWEMLKRMGRYLRGIARMVIYRTAMVKEDMERDERSKVPFAIAVLGGAILVYTDATLRFPEFWDWYIGMLGFGDKA